MILCYFIVFSSGIAQTFCMAGSTLNQQEKLSHKRFQCALYTSHRMLKRHEGRHISNTLYNSHQWNVTIYEFTIHTRK
jgi:hypothetical protein